jgi:hypothetical protein
VPSQFFTELVETFKDTSLDDRANQIVENECKNYNITPEELLPKDGANLILGIMISAGKYLEGKEWNTIDNRLKELLNKYEDKPLTGKVKGDVLCAALEYISIKGGRESLAQIKREAEIAKDPWGETWYPITFLADVLKAIETHMGTKNGLRCKEVGNHVISHLLFLFKDAASHSLFYSFRRIKEIFDLKEFFFWQEPPDNIVIGFNGNLSRPIIEFLEGVCEGILSLRDVNAKIVIKIDDSNDVYKINIDLN